MYATIRAECVYANTGNVGPRRAAGAASSEPSKHGVVWVGGHNYSRGIHAHDIIVSEWFEIVYWYADARKANFARDVDRIDRPRSLNTKANTITMAAAAVHSLKHFCSSIASLERLVPLLSFNLPLVIALFLVSLGLGLVQSVSKPVLAGHQGQAKTYRHKEPEHPVERPHGRRVATEHNPMYFTTLQVLIVLILAILQ